MQFWFLLFVTFIISCGPNVKVNDLTYTHYGQPDPSFAEPHDTFAPPNNITRDVLQDRNGYFWLASWQGLIRYDGKSFHNITLEKGLKHFRFFCILEADNGDLWFGTMGAGVYRYDGKTFTNFTEDNGLANNRVGCLLEDKDGNIWFGTDKGASRYDGKSFTNFTTKEGICDTLVHTIAQDKSGNIWFGTTNGICLYDGKSFRDFLNRNSLPFNNVRSIKKDKIGNIWIGSEDGLVRYDGKSQINITSSFISYIFEDKAGNLLLSAGDTSITSPPPKFGFAPRNSINGMVLYRYNGKVLTKIITKNKENDSQIFRAIEDKSGNIWFGTMQGVCRYDGNSSKCFTE